MFIMQVFFFQVERENLSTMMSRRVFLSFSDMRTRATFSGVYFSSEVIKKERFKVSLGGLIDFI